MTIAAHVFLHFSLYMNEALSSIPTKTLNISLKRFQVLLFISWPRRWKRRRQTSCRFYPAIAPKSIPFKEALVSDSVDYSRVAAALSGELPLLNLPFSARPLNELLEMEKFWELAGAYVDPVLNIEGEFWIDSNFKWRVRRENLVDYSFAIRKA